MNKRYVKRALISVSDKTDIIEFAQQLTQLGIEIISTGGTFSHLSDHGVPVTYISDVTHFPEILDGRVKTLHPAIHGAILAKRDDPTHSDALNREKIVPLDLIVVNLYPFQRAAQNPDADWESLIENIDIGGPAMIRSAAKNHQDVIVATDPADYKLILDELAAHHDCTPQTRVKLAIKAFQMTAQYDALIAQTLPMRSPLLTEEDTARLPVTLSLTCVDTLRYGENPNQPAALYRDMLAPKPAFIDAKQLNGKALSYNNWLDSDSAFRLIQSFDTPAAVIVKHTNPCGVAISDTILHAFEKALAADPVSAFGGILAVNRQIDAELAKEIARTFWEVIIAPDYSQDALAILAEKKNLRVLCVPEKAWKIAPEREWRSIIGGLLCQDRDLACANFTAWQTVTKSSANPAQIADYELAWKVVKQVKSNAIVIVKDGATVGIGAGQMNRVGAAKIALEQAGEHARGAVMSSDAFFPFGDTVSLAAQYGIHAIIQPGGSVRDHESIDAADTFNMVMFFTDERHFRH